MDRNVIDRSKKVFENLQVRSQCSQIKGSLIFSFSVVTKLSWLWDLFFLVINHGKHVVNNEQKVIMPGKYSWSILEGQNWVAKWVLAALGVAKESESLGSQHHWRVFPYVTTYFNDFPYYICTSTSKWTVRFPQLGVFIQPTQPLLLTIIRFSGHN